MTINIRRVVTSHDANGKAIVRIDDMGTHVASGRPNMTRQLIWTTNDLPVHFAEDGEDKEPERSAPPSEMGLCSGSSNLSLALHPATTGPIALIMRW